MAAAYGVVATPALAQSVPVPTGLADLGLLGAGVVGLLVGRFGSRSRPN